jgi:hypothetical protein
MLRRKIRPSRPPPPGRNGDPVVSWPAQRALKQVAETV